MSKKFLLDANVFIEARNRYYAHDICPGFWSSLAQAHTRSLVFSIDRIRSELVPKKKEDWDEIAKWIDQHLPIEFFKGTQDQGVFDAFQRMVNWVYAQPQFTQGAKAEFASVADGWLVAHAAANRLVVVTQEVFAPDAKKKVPIPNVCEKFGVEYVDTFTMLRVLKIKFVRATKR